ncbi:hypothetical protein C7N43_35645 [Sphingobacteriales bacterium UPWRP_1]|nr:hypothetical protein C7N43_35645 [Sphingobacteriales bacterium UPWRP_1]
MKMAALLSRYVIVCAACCLWAAGSRLHAQEYTALEIPEKYARPQEDVSTAKTSDITKGKVWVVYSDRAKNNTYTEAGGSTQQATLGFLEELYPVDEKGDFLHVVQGSLKEGSLKVQVTSDKGWISKSSLLLWSNCLVTPDNITKKAMLLNTPEGLGEKSVIVNGAEEIRFYSDPKLSGLTDKYSPPNHIFFIFKQDGNRLLLGVNDKHDPTYVKLNIVGWVSLNQFTEWNNRVALEPNCEVSATTERWANGVRASVYKDYQSALSFSLGEPVNPLDIIWEDDTTFERRPGEWRRIIVTGHPENNILKTLVCLGNNNWTIGYIAMYRAGLRHPLFSNSLFLTRSELGNIVISLEMLSDAGTSADRRQQMYKTWLEILQKYTGGKRSDFENMTMDEINRQVFGLPGGKESMLRDVKLLDIPQSEQQNSCDCFTKKSTSMLREWKLREKLLDFAYADCLPLPAFVKLREITDASVVNEVQFEEYIHRIAYKYRQLYKAFNQDNYRYAFRSNGVTYYWIAEDMLP